ncbi:MAG TPA: hypothetical protein PK794_11265, partial [Armatimonadota bacterium]|nr:hypothetical protein [Armatimonadota bacterium]
VQMYVQDHDETFMRDPGTHAWSSLLKDYNEPTIYDCPTKTGKGSNTAPEYGFNSYLFGKALGDVANPAEALLIADLAMDDPAPHYGLVDFSVDLHARHNKGLVLACADGHVAVEAIGANNMFAYILGKYDCFPAAQKLVSLADTTMNWSGNGKQLFAGTIPAALMPTSAEMPSLMASFTIERPSVLPGGVDYGMVLYHDATAVKPVIEAMGYSTAAGTFFGAMQPTTSLIIGGVGDWNYQPTADKIRTGAQFVQFASASAQASAAPIEKSDWSGPYNWSESRLSAQVIILGPQKKILGVFKGSTGWAGVITAPLPASFDAGATFTNAGYAFYVKDDGNSSAATDFKNVYLSKL